MNDEPDFLYYDMVVSNRQTSNSTQNTLLIFNETRQNPLIMKPDNYHMSVVRFQLDTTSIPVHRFEVQPRQNDADLGIYSVTLEYFTALNTSLIGNEEYLIWTPQNLDVQKPDAPSLTSNGFQVDSPYYYSYMFQHMVSLTQDALQRAFDKLQVIVGAPLNSAKAPVIEWNIDRQSAYITCSKDYYNQSVYPHIKIFLNRSLHYLFNSLPCIEYSHNVTKGRNYLIRFPFEIDGNPGTDLASYQEYSTISNWSPLSSIIFTTGSLPIVANELSEPVIYENNVRVNLTRGGDQIERIISDFISDENCYRSNLLYNPTAEYRWIDMYNSAPIRNINIQVYWKDKFGNLNPFYLDPGNSCSIKLLFKKKI